MIDISERLKAIRKEKKATIQAVSAGSGIASRTYQNYEYGKREISAEALVKLADYYGVTTDYLLGREPAEEKTEDKFIQIYSGLPEETREFFISTIKKLTDY
ncbi:MAG: helix-turn-helix domain-containing protein [Hominimerdicola sp.]